MRELSIFVDESGSGGLSDRHYLLGVVMHDQSESIADSIESYEGALRAKGLPDIPFHASPLMNGKDQYSGLDLGTRKALPGSFRVFFRHTPARYHTFACATKQPARSRGSQGPCELPVRQPRDRVRAVEGHRRLPLGAALRVPALAGGGLHLHHEFAEHATTATDEKLFGKWSDFKKGILKETRKKLV